MNDSVNSKSITSNMIWHFAEKWGCQIVSFVITIIIARLLDPSSYGVVAMVNAFTQIFTVFIDAGLGNALIQKKDVDNKDYSVALYANIVLCVLIYLIIYIASPYLAKYYDEESLTLLLRVSSVSILIYAFKNILQSYISKNMMFKKFFFASLTGTIGSGVVGVIMALKGYGPWALVISNLFDVAVDTVFMWFSIKWKPELYFSLDRFKSLFNFGSKILVAALIERLYNKMYHLVIGKAYTSEDLAYYDKGNSLTSKVADNIDAVINSVLFPVLSNVQDDKQKIKIIASKTLKINTYVMTPILVGIIVVCEPLVSVLLTDKWLLAVPYIRLFCLINILLPFQTTNKNIIKSLGKSNTFLRQEVMKKIIGVAILVISVNYGPIIIVIGKLLLNVISVCIDAKPNKQMVNYGLFEQIKDVMPTLFISCLMGIIVYLFNYLSINNLLLLIIQGLMGCIIYIVLSLISKNESFYYLKKIILKK